MMNKTKLKEKFTEIVALRLDVFEQRKAGIWPPDTDLNAWRTKYAGTQNLPPHTVELNHFKTEVDQFVAMLMTAIEEVEASVSIIKFGQLIEELVEKREDEFSVADISRDVRFITGEKDTINLDHKIKYHLNRLDLPRRIIGNTNYYSSMTPSPRDE